MKDHPLYQAWKRIKRRCYSPEAHNYKHYGGRGIRVCDEWRSDPAAFISYIERELGPRPQGKSLDRIDNDGDYRPGNVRWATQAEQNANKRAPNGYPAPERWMLGEHMQPVTPGGGQPAGAVLVDTGNQLLREVAAQLTTDVIDTPVGQRLVMTVRTTSATLTVFLGGKDAKTWAAQLSGAADMMSSAGLVVARGSVPDPKTA